MFLVGEELYFVLIIHCPIICNWLYHEKGSSVDRMGTDIAFCACTNLCCSLTPWIKVLEKLTVTQLGKKYPTIYGIWRFITLFTRFCHWSLSWTRWIQSTHSHSISQRSVLIVFSHVHLGIPSGLLPWDSLTIMFVFLMSSMMLHALPI